MKTMVSLVSVLALLGCGSEDQPSPVNATPAMSCTSSGSETFVIARFGFVRASTTQSDVSEGFDLDDHVSYNGDSVGCGQPDFVTSDGRTGIDNQLARLLPIVDSMTGGSMGMGGALDGAIQSAINNGQLLVAITVDDIQNRCDDSSVNVTLLRVSGMPFVGSDMRIDPGQTFDVQRMVSATRIRGRIRRGELQTEAANVPLPVEVFGERFVLNLYGAKMSLRFNASGGADGYLGGGISSQEFIVSAQEFDIPDTLRSSVASAFRLVSDLDPDKNGRCRNVSAALQLTLRSAFVNP
jgi:hypothetical protein